MTTKRAKPKQPTKARKPAQAPTSNEQGLAIGTRLKHARLSRGTHLRELAEVAGCTESFLSKVENDKVRPSLTMLHRIVGALGISIAKLFSEQDDDGGPVSVLRAGTRPMLATDRARTGAGIRLEALLPTYRTALLEANVHHVEPGGSSEGTIQHQGEEMGFVLKGHLELLVDGKVVQVSEGDSFFFLSSLPHGYRNPGQVPAQILWVNTPQSF